MREIRIATAQFEHRDNDREFNLGRIDALTQVAAERGAEIVSFHEGCISGYSWIQPLNKDELLEMAELVPRGPSVQALIEIARKHGVHVMAGLFERDEADHVYNCYVTVGPEGYVSKFHKLHPFVNPHLTPGADYCVIDLLGCRVGFLICYDNNLPENVRVTAMEGAEIIFMPHVTGCLPSVMPGRGSVAASLWDNRHRDPVALRQEFRGPKGRGWLMRWLPTRAFENGVYAVFSNPIGRDYNTIKPGLSMILDPYGEVLVECNTLDDEVVVATLTPEKLKDASGSRYRLARRPELYGKLVEPQVSQTLPGWRMEHETDDSRSNRSHVDDH